MKRKIIYFEDVGIPNLFLLGKVELLKASSPICRHTHSGQFEICIHYEGCQRYFLDETEYETHAGDIFVSFPDESHSTGSDNEEKSRLFYLIFNCDRDTKQFLGLNDSDSDYIVNKLFSIKARVFPGGEAVRPILENMMSLYFSNDSLRASMLHSCAVQFFRELCRLIDQAQAKKPPLQAIQPALDYISDHPFEIPSGTFLAKLCYLSDSYFKRSFKALTSFSPHDYILRRQVSMAKEKLSGTDIPITSLAQELGFSSSQIFARIFKRYTGNTPGEYRIKNTLPKRRS